MTGDIRAIAEYKNLDLADARTVFGRLDDLTAILHENGPHPITVRSSATRDDLSRPIPDTEVAEAELCALCLAIHWKLHELGWRELIAEDGRMFDAIDGPSWSFPIQYPKDFFS